MNRIRELRERKGIKAEKLADILGITVRYLYGLETGKRRLNEDHIKRLCDILEVDADYLLGRSTLNPPRSLQEKVFDPAYEPTEVDLEDFLKVANIRFHGDPIATEDKEKLLRIAEILWEERRKDEIERRK